jgi:hypothetical protein
MLFTNALKPIGKNLSALNSLSIFCKKLAEISISLWRSMMQSYSSQVGKVLKFYSSALIEVSRI